MARSVMRYHVVENALSIMQRKRAVPRGVSRFGAASFHNSVPYIIALTLRIAIRCLPAPEGLRRGLRPKFGPYLTRWMDEIMRSATLWEARPNYQPV